MPQCCHVNCQDPADYLVRFTAGGEDRAYCGFHYGQLESGTLSDYFETLRRL